MGSLQRINPRQEKMVKKLSKSKHSLENLSEKRKLLAATHESEKKKNRKKKKQRLGDKPADEEHGNGESHDEARELSPVAAYDQLRLFLDQYQSANGVQLSSLELESISDSCILELSQCPDQVTETVGEDMKVAFGPSWKKVLCEKRLAQGKVDPGCPSILVISVSALRSIELLRGLRLFTKDCHAAKLFSKHMKVEDQFGDDDDTLTISEYNNAELYIYLHVSLIPNFHEVSVLKSRVNIASGTPNRIKKLIDMEALGLSRLTVILLDIRPDVKGYSLFTLPQVRDEFWDLYKNYFHQRLVEGTSRLALYGSLPKGPVLKGKKETQIHG